MLFRPQVHRILDYVTVLVFAAAPTLFHLAGAPAVLAYVLAGVHLALTLATKFPDSGPRPVPIGLHAVTEFVVGIVLVTLPWFVWAGAARTFFVVAGVVILVVWMGTTYSERQHHHASS